jgi:predicted nucleic acid-binding protein
VRVTPTVANPNVTPTIVVDASALVALLLDSGAAGTWVATSLFGSDLAAPHLVMFETANIIRRHCAAKLISIESARHANTHLARLAVSLWPFEPLAERVWELRSNLTSYDASYVALAESLGATFVTLDTKIAAVKRLRCKVATPPLS